MTGLNRGAHGHPINLGGSGSGESVNVTTEIAALEGDWIGVKCVVLCPHPADARHVEESIKVFLRALGMNDQAAAVGDLMTTEINAQARPGFKPEPIDTFWPSHYPAVVRTTKSPLVVRGGQR